MSDLTAAAYPSLGGDAARLALLDFCERIQTKASRALIRTFTIPIRSGQAWKVPAGHTCRITTAEGPQVGTLFKQVLVLESTYAGRQILVMFQ